MGGLTATQLVTLACQDAHAPGFTSQAQQFLNMILSDLCQTYDLEVAAGTSYGYFSLNNSALIGNSIYGSGPYALPLDFLRFKDEKAAFWTLLGVVYDMIPCDLGEFDLLVQQAGTQSYPYVIATDMSLSDVVQQGLPAGTPGAFYVYSPPSGTYPYTLRYYRQMPDIDFVAAPNTIPWFPNQGYLRKKLAAAVMGQADDSRQSSWDAEADNALRSYLLMKDNRSNRATTVKPDRRRFGQSFSTLPNTKRIGWVLLIATVLPLVLRVYGAGA